VIKDCDDFTAELLVEMDSEDDSDSDSGPDYNRDDNRGAAGDSEEDLAKVPD
jgi:hypothetical protein